ncbi:carboxymuconolactone decarboxylase family protein [Pseudarthrobacter oxydans]|uniref:carboxymuconolactone decarboxylase family protein n=1 Tax=Pseudarthrobacter oxydans TaxID=1671 RepID=UPI0037F93DF0
MIKDELFDAGLELRHRMFGRAGAEDMLDDPSDLMAKLQEIVTRYCFGDIWQREELDQRTRSMITLAMLVALGKDHEIRIHLRGALANGVTEIEIREIMLHSFLYCGIPAAVNGLKAAEEVFSHTNKEATVNG